MLTNQLQQTFGDRFHDDRARLLTDGSFDAVSSAAMPFIAIHHTTGARDLTPQAIAEDHVRANGWSGIGFHFLVRQGHVHYVGDVDTKRAHVRGRNHEALGIAITGEYGTTPPADEDVTALRQLVRVLDDFYGHPKTLIGHRDMVQPNETACPGDQLQALLPTLRQPAPPADDRIVQIRIPWVSQMGPGAEFGTGDCGLTCATAQIRALKDATVTVDRVCQSVNLQRGFTSADLFTVQRAAGNFGVRLEHRGSLTVADIERELLDRRPVLLLVFYPRLHKKFDPHYDQGHYVTVTGMTRDEFIYDDPFWPARQDGEDIRIPKQALVNAANAVPNVSFRFPGQGLVNRSSQFPILDLGTRGLGDDVDELEEQARGLDEARPGLTLQGRVTRDGRAVANASVRLIGAQALLGDVPGTVLAPAPGAVVWSRAASGLSGSRWEVWEQQVRTQTEMPFSDFKDQALLHNPDLEGDGFAFRPDKTYLLPEPAFVVTWTRPVTGVSGARWQTFVDHVEQQVRGITARTFIDEVVAHNAALRENPVFQKKATYRFPENLTAIPTIAWTRPLTNFVGSRWDGWTAYVRDHVAGLMTWEAFSEEVERRNPTLASEDRHVFRRERSYVLPELVYAAQYVLPLWSDDAGAFRVTGLRAGDYELHVVAADGATARQSLRLEGDATQDVALAAPAPRLRVEPQPDTSGFVQARGSDFVLDGQKFRHVGVNIRGLVHYGDRRLLPFSDASHRQAQLEAAEAMGARVVRLFLGNRHASTDETAARFEQVLGMLAQRDLRAIVAFCDVHGDTGFNPPGVERFYTEGGMLNHAFYTGGYRDQYLPFVQAIVTRFRDNRTVMAWELGNEFKPIEGGQVKPETFISFARDVGALIRALDPVHLIATGIINSFSLGCSPEQARRLNSLPTVSFLTAHIYEGVPEPDSQGDWLQNQQVELARAAQEADLARELKKPFIIEEVGFCGGDRVAKSQEHLTRWYDQKRAAACFPWGLMATEQDIGDGDNTFGMDRVRHRDDFQRLVDLFRQRAGQLV